MNDAAPTIALLVSPEARSAYFKACGEVALGELNYVLGAAGATLRSVGPLDFIELQWDQSRLGELASEIAVGSSPTAVSIVKKMTWGRLMDDGELYRAIYEDDDAIAWAINGPDVAEGSAAFFEKRPANWVPVVPETLPKFGRRNANPFGES